MVFCRNVGYYRPARMNSQGRKSPLSETDLISYSKEHLRHEVVMFFKTGALLSRIPNDMFLEESVVSKNALLEAYIIHLRNLILFLYPHRVEANDIISDHFFVDPIKGWKRHRPKMSRALQEALTRSHREVAHLTTLRHPKPKPAAWPIRSLMEEIKNVVQIFVDHASPSRLDPALKKWVTEFNPSSVPRPATDPSSGGL